MNLKNKVTIALLFFMALNLVPGPLFAQNKIGDKWAYIVGISNYKDSELNCPGKAENAKKFFDFLTRESNFKPDHCKLFLDANATREKILTDMFNSFLPRNVSSEDLLVIYLSGFISPPEWDVKKLNFFLFNDSMKSNVFATGMDIQSLSRVINSRLRCKNIVLVLDGEYSQGALTQNKDEYFEIRRDCTELLTICSGNLSKNGKNNTNNLFTEKLITALKSKGQQTSLQEALKQFKEPGQHARESTMQSELVIAAPASQPRPAPEY